MHHPVQSIPVELVCKAPIVNNPLLPWIAFAAAVLLMPLLTLLAMRKRRPSGKALPTEWTLTGRPVFSSDERRIYRLLREALPHHVILSKLPLVRFCQPTSSSEVRYWYDLLGATHVAFAVCSANGRVLAAIDLDVERGPSGRSAKIKQSVLEACRVRHLVCPMDQLPSIAELQLLVPHSGTSSRAPLPPPTLLDEARDSLASTVANRRAQRTALWQDSTLFQDSFFAMDSRLDAYVNSDFTTLSDRPENAPLGKRPPPYVNDVAHKPRVGSEGDAVGGVVVDTPDPNFITGGSRR
jgi:hypothetical protein